MALTAGMAGPPAGSAHGAIVIDTRSLREAATTARQAAAEIEGALGGVSTTTQQTEQSFTSMGNAARAAGALIATYLTRQTAAAAVELARTSAVAAGMRQEFLNLTGVTEESADQMLDAMRRASWGLVSDFELIASANRAFLFGVAENTEDMIRLLEIATARGAAMGISTEQAFEAIVMGLGRLEPRWLQQIGVTIRAQDAYDRFAESSGRAASELSEMERRQALLNVIYAESTEQIENMREAGETNAGALERASAAAANARLAFGALIEDDVVGAATTYAESLERIVHWLTRLREEMRGETSEWQLLDVTGASAAESELEQFQRMLETLREERDKLLQQHGSPFFDPTDLANVEQRIRDVERAILDAEIAMRRAAGEAMPSWLTPSLPTPFVRDPARPMVSLAPPAASAGAGAAPSIDTEALLSAQRDYHRSLRDIERQAAQARQSATESFAQQRTQTIRSYEQRIAREAGDFARQRARAMEGHQTQIAQIQADAAAREARQIADHQERLAGMREQSAQRVADWTADHELRIAQLREQGTTRVEQIEEDYRRNRERAAGRHQETLLAAGSRLDARAVAEEMRRFDREAQEQEEAHAVRLRRERDAQEERIAQEQAAHQRRLDREARNLQERIDQEQSAHQRRLADARAADDRRLQDMQTAFQERIDQEDEERAIRLERQADDHRDQLRQMEASHADRLRQIDRQQGEQRARLDDRFQDQLADLGLFNRDWLRIQEEKQREATELFEEMWEDWVETMAQARRDMLEAESDLDPSEEGDPDVMQPASFVPDVAPAAVVTGGNSRSTAITLGAGAIQVFGAPGQSPGDIAEAVDRRLLEVLERAADT
jgi:hypothetical protein